MFKVAVISAILENPNECQAQFNQIVSEFGGIIRGRMGIPVAEADISVISITVIGKLDEINTLTGRLGKIENVSVKTSISKKEVDL